MATTGVLEQPVNGRDKKDPMYSVPEHRLLEDTPDIIGDGFTMSRRVPLHEEELLAALLRLSTGQERQNALQESTAKALDGVCAKLDSGQKASLPTWLMSILVVTVLSLLGWVYLEQFGDLKHRLDIQETFIKNTREEMRAHGWRLDRDGNLYWPDDAIPPSKGK